jgi:ketosteroid isomerase-like protein
MSESVQLEQPTIGATSDRQNARLLQAFYAALSAGDVSAGADLVYPDFVAHVPGRGINAGEYWGIEGFKTLASSMLAHHGGRFDIRVPVISVNGDDVYTRELLTVNRAADPERLWTLPISMHYKIKAGKISELWVLPEDQRLYDDYWSGPAVERANGNPVVRLDEPEPTPTGQVDIDGASSPETLALLSQLYDRFFRGDNDVLQDMISEKVVVNIVGLSAMSGEYHGWDGFMQFRQKLMSMVGQKYKLEIDNLAASETDGWVKEYIRMDRVWDPTFATIYVVMHFEFQDGKVTQIDDFPVDTYAWEDFYTPPAS